MLLALHIPSQVTYHTNIGFGGRNGDDSYLAGAVNRQIDIFDNVSLRKETSVPILLCVSVYLVSVTTLCDMIICLCRCKGRMGHGNALDSKLDSLVTNLPDIVLPVTIKSEN